MTSAPLPILCVGQLVADVVVRPVDALPSAGRTELVTDLQLLAGGCAANTACVLAKLGAPVALASMIGADALGDMVVADLVAVGVRPDLIIRRKESPTSAAIVLTQSSGERSFLYRNGGNEHLTQQDIPDAALQAARIVHIGGALKLVNLDLGELTRRAKACGCLTALDTDWDVHGQWMRKLQPALPHLDYLLTNEEEAAMLTGARDYRAAAESLRAQGPHTIVIKRGPHGLLVATGTDTVTLPAHRVDVFDTTCAGDSCVAGFLYGISRGWSIAESARLANATGALCTTQFSHRGIVSLEATQHFLAAHPASDGKGG